MMDRRSKALNIGARLPHAACSLIFTRNGVSACNATWVGELHETFVASLCLAIVGTKGLVEESVVREDGTAAPLRYMLPGPWYYTKTCTWDTECEEGRFSLGLDWITMGRVERGPWTVDVYAYGLRWILTTGTWDWNCLLRAVCFCVGCGGW